MSKTIASGYHPVFSFNCSRPGEGFCKLFYDSYGAMVVRKALVKSNMFKENNQCLSHDPSVLILGSCTWDITL